MRPVLQMFLFLILVLSLSHAKGEVYFWTDDNGIRHFSNVCAPAGKKVKQLPESKASVLDESPFTVTKVFDGDTIEVQGEDLEIRIRLVAIDAPETGGGRQNWQPYSRRAKNRLTELVRGKKIRLKQYGTGGYNRILAEVFCRGENINLTMIRQGLAEVYRGRFPDNLNISEYKNAEKEARQKRKGIWSQGSSYKSPKIWRKENPR